MTFPAGDYTPHGYLRNPFAAATAWSDPRGGVLRTSDVLAGMEWVFPTAHKPLAGFGLALVAHPAGVACVTRANFEALGYTSRYHSSNVLGLDWSADEVGVAARYFLVGDALCLRLTGHNGAATPRTLRLDLVLRAWAETPLAPPRHDTGAILASTAAPAPAGSLALALDTPSTEVEPPPVAADSNEARAARTVRLKLDPGASGEVFVALGRGETPEAALTAARAALADAPAHLAALIAEDAAFWARCPELAGDWPTHWREGFVYDLETTRLLVMPPGGIFRDVWPAWMATWPRVVLAEGALDMLRLAYGDPDLAQRAVLTLFRDAPAPNVPCVFVGGEPNMVARDGSVCGTSPAWCLPFLQLELLYLRTLDRDWLRALYPYLAAYVAWWLEHRVDRHGWVVYRCTWESGEDGNPRLDPTGSGDAVISHHARPVELQATLAHAADVLAFFAAEIGLPDDRRRWLALRRRFVRRTRALYDPGTGRFRDWLIAERRFQEPRPDDLYWGVDTRRYSPLALTPLLGSIASPDQRDALVAEVALHATAPWTWWPSWCSTLLECAAAAGLHELAGEVTWRVLDRVYRQNDRRSLADLPRPTPGAAREYWPQDLRGWGAADAYGWGATTANLLVRHLLGLQESRATAAWSLDLAPALPAALRQPGRRLGVRHASYRGHRFDLFYTWTAADVHAELSLDAPASLTLDGPVRQRARRANHHVFRLRNGQRHHLTLRF